MPKNYYVILGLNTTASPRQIKDAYRRLAKELHPDRSGLESEPFREVQEAYSVLSDPIQRRHYDRGSSAQDSRSQAEPFNQTGFVPRGGIEPLIPKDQSGYRAESFRPSLEDLLARWWGNFDHSTRPKSEQPERLTVEVLLSPEEARRGGRVLLGIPVRAACGFCQGRGGLGGFECWRCAGRGIHEVDYPIQLTYPPSARDTVQHLDLMALGISNFFLTVHFRIR